MELSSARVDAGIRWTQVGNALADGCKGFRYCTSCDRFIFAAMAAVSDGVDKEVAEPKFLVAQALTEGAGHVLFVAELDPVAKGGRLSVAVSGGVGFADELESRFEISLEIDSLGGGTSCQGLCCGY